MPMPSGNEIQASLRASWQLMQGKPEALRQLDLSADGFWNSFFAFVVAIPPFFVFWTSEAIDLAPGSFGERFGIVLRLAIIEAVAWAGPLFLIAYGLYRMGRRDRVSAFVVANNWGSALVSWIILPIILLVTLFPSQADVGAILMLFALVAIVVLFWRLNNAVLNMGPAVTTGVVVGMIAIPLAIDYVLRILLAVPVSYQAG